MGNGICHSGDTQEQEIQHQQKQKFQIISLPNSYAQSPSKPTIETQNPTISINHEDCCDILLTSSLDIQDVQSNQKVSKNSIQPISPNVETSIRDAKPSIELLLPNSLNTKPILKITEKLKENQSKKKVRFDDQE